jgi:hypothetical protein
MRMIWRYLVKNLEINPWELAEQYLLSLGIDWDDLYNDRGGIRREQLTIMQNAPFFSDLIIANTRQTINRLEKSANKKNINFAANVMNTMIGTVATGITETIHQETPPETLIIWTASFADEIDPLHAVNYGRTMTLKTAQKKELGTRYGCKCGMAFPVTDPEMDELKKKFEV